MKSPLRRSSDIRSLLLEGFILCLMLYSLTLNFSDLTLFTYFLLLLFVFFGVFISTLINHNHRHHLIFKKAHYNQFFNYLLSLTIGAPSTRLHLVHHFNHHQHYPSHEDWSHFEINAQGSGIKRICTYLYNSTVIMAKNRDQLVRSAHHKKSLRNEKIILYLASILSLIINWKIFIFVIFPGWFLGLSALLTSNLLNHDQCNTTSKINHSRDFLNKIENWFFCNNGYHTAHHLKPNLHWEELPRLHLEKVSSLKDSKYTSGSFFVYLFQYCLKKS